MKRVLVTGATGFCGRHLCAWLAGQGHRVSGTTFGEAEGHSPQIEIYPLDIMSPQDAAGLIRDVRPEWLFHLAAQSAPRLSWEQMERTFAVNVAGTVNLLDAVRRHAPGCRFLLASSSQVYGKTFQSQTSVAENDLLLPETPYAASKAVAEYACLNFLRQFGLEAVIARAFNHVGSGQPVHLVFSDWCRQIALAEAGKRKPVLEVGNVEVEREFLHVSDVVRAYGILMERGSAGEVYNIALGRCVRLRTHMEFLLARARVRMEAVSLEAKLRKDDPPVAAGDASKIRALGWRPEASIEEALADLLEDWRQKVRDGRDG